MDNTELVDSYLTGRVKPHIYAFETGTIPNYLKVGDTYRPVLKRLNEWRKKYPDLIHVQHYMREALVDNDVYFRDYAVHDFLINNLGKERLLLCEMNKYPDGTHYSKEFFMNTSVDDIDSAIDSITQSYKNKDGRYQFYNASTTLPETHTYPSTGFWEIRPNQQEAVDNFVRVVDNNRTNLLMYAVMRFGKTFTSLCCAKAKNYKSVLVVSAKADVKREWQETVQSADNFNKDYVFLDSDDLAGNYTVIKDTLSSSKGVVVFLTLQDLQGEVIKDKHREIFSNEMDLLIVDETHFGARAESYGEIVKHAQYIKDSSSSVKGEEDDYIEVEEADSIIKRLNVKVKLHLSGTPYRILMGSEFEKEDIISFCQFSDIVEAKEKWDEDYLNEDDVEEWHNPYYGFPQMIRFAFNPSKKARALMDSMRKDGYSYALTKLFEPVSKIKSDDESHKRFIHKDEVLELFLAIDGAESDDAVFAFLDYEKSTDQEMCRHIVCVLPFRASCDALEELIKSNSTKFKHLNEYQIINISGVDNTQKYKTIDSIKTTIRDCEEKDKKTLTLTVNRMLTGSTVKQWDTMIFLKDTVSPQEYDQAIFRLQNQYVDSYENAEGKTIKISKKDQTILVDFDPNRLFIMQEQKSKIYNVNTDKSGNDHLYERLQHELSISPVIMVSNNRLKQVEPVDILTYVSNYSSKRGVKEEAGDIPVDLQLMNNDQIKKEIDRQEEFGNKGGLKIIPHDGDDDYDFGNSSDETNKDNNTDDINDDAEKPSVYNGEESAPKKQFENKFKTYYSRILFFAFLTDDRVTNLSDIINVSVMKENSRIIKNLGIDLQTLCLLKDLINPFIRSTLDYKINNINSLSHDESIPCLDRAITAMGKFGRISEAEVTTNISIAEKMISMIPDECFLNLVDTHHFVMDIASKMGEFAIAVCKRMESLGISADRYSSQILSIPSSSIGYEFTLKVYKILGLDLRCINNKWNSYSLLKFNGDKNDYQSIVAAIRQSFGNEEEMIKGDNEMFFDVVVGNPPYQEDDGGAGASAKPIYPFFFNTAVALEPSYISMIMPTKWYTGGKHLDDFRKQMLNDIHICELHDCLHPEDIFPDTNNRGGVCYLLWDSSYDNTDKKVSVYTHKDDGESYHIKRSLKTRNYDVFIRDSKGLGILDKVIPINHKVDVIMNHVSSRKPFGLEGGSFLKSGDFHDNFEGLVDPIRCYGKSRVEGFVERAIITTHIEWIDEWKVFMPYANNIGTELNDDNQNTFIGEPGTVCTETYIMVGGDMNLNESQARNLSEYLKTKFARYMLSLAKTSHHGTSATYRFVPVVDFNISWSDKMLYDKYGLTDSEIEHIEKSIKPME